PITERHQLTGLLGAVLAAEDHQRTPHRRLPLSVLGTPAILARPSRPGAQARTCPSPSTTHVDVVSSARPIGPRACSFCVEIPISAPRPSWRSEEHTSELQSREKLVCRLLLEK